MKMRFAAGAASLCFLLTGAVSTFATNQTHLVVHTNGYFAP